MDEKPRSGFLGEWDRLAPNMRIAAVVLLTIPLFLYPPAVFIYFGYAVYIFVRDRRKKEK